MPFLLAEILNFQGSTHHIGVGSFSYLYFPDREERYSVIRTIVCSAKSFEPSQMVKEELLFKEWCRNSWNGLPEETIQKKMLALVTCSYGSRDERTICFAMIEK